MTASQTPYLRREDRKILKLIERLEKLKLQAKTPSSASSIQPSLAS